MLKSTRDGQQELAHSSWSECTDQLGVDDIYILKPEQAYELQEMCHSASLLGELIGVWWRWAELKHVWGFKFQNFRVNAVSVCIIEETVCEPSCDHSVVAGWLQSADEFSLVDDGIWYSWSSRVKSHWLFSCLLMFVPISLRHISKPICSVFFRNAYLQRWFYS